jgi:hypothetical protein
MAPAAAAGPSVDAHRADLADRADLAHLARRPAAALPAAPAPVEPPGPPAPRAGIRLPSLALGRLLEAIAPASPSRPAPRAGGRLAEAPARLAAPSAGRIAAAPAERRIARPASDAGPGRVVAADAIEAPDELLELARRITEQAARNRARRTPIAELDPEPAPAAPPVVSRPTPIQRPDASPGADAADRPGPAPRTARHLEVSA